MTDTKTLGDELPKEMARIRDEVLPCYIEIGAAGAFAATGMRRDLDAASKAMIDGDLVGMIRAYESLKSWTV